MANQEFTEVVPALQLRITDPAMQLFLQTYPFVSSTDIERNRLAREAVKGNWVVRPLGTPAEIVMLSPDKARPPKEPLGRLEEMFAALHFDEDKKATALRDFAWKLNLVPPEARNVLAVGCGDGIELLFLRAFLPDAKLTAVDYHDSMSEEWKKLVGVSFLAGDMHAHLGSFAGGFDLIFSNHVLEHMFTPDEMLATLFGLLSEGGSLVSGIPMDTCGGSPFLGYVLRLAGQESIHPLDYVFLDAGHAWKTNPSDLNETLKRAGFAKVILNMRSMHLSRYFAGDLRQFETSRKVGVALNVAIFGPWRWLLKMLFPRHIPERIPRILFALERRVNFGSNRVKNRFAFETVFCATK